MNNWRLLLITELMELIMIFSRSSMGISNTQLERLQTLYKGLTDSGREYIQIWIEENSFTLPKGLIC